MYDSQLMKYNLQFFAKEGPGGEKTEDATAKKLSDTRKEGQVAKSTEVSMGITLLSLFITLKFFMAFIGTRFLNTFVKFYEYIPRYTSEGLNITNTQGLVNQVIIDMIIIMAPFLIIGLVAAVLSNIIQFKWQVTAKPMMPKLNKINPISGFKRMFSMRTIMELIKSILKVVVICYVVYDTISNQSDILYKLYDVTINNALLILFDLIISLGIKISMLMLVIGFADFLYQKWKFKQDNKMSKQEVKDEYKNTEGDPKVKGQQKQRMMQASQRRMMSSIPDADVVITNPTHFAVALQYESGTGSAPKVVAKGADFLASKIKDIARESSVEIVEDKKLARMLYYNVNIGDEIPEELYKSVAEIIAYVYQLRNKVV